MDAILDSGAHDTLLHEGAHKELFHKGDFTNDFHELFAITFSLANSKMPHFTLAKIANTYYWKNPVGNHYEVSAWFFEMFKPQYALAKGEPGRIRRIITDSAHASAEELRAGADGVARELCAMHSIDLEGMRARIIEAAQKAVFG